MLRGCDLENCTKGNQTLGKVRSWFRGEPEVQSARARSLGRVPGTRQRREDKNRDSEQRGEDRGVNPDSGYVTKFGTGRRLLVSDVAPT